MKIIKWVTSLVYVCFIAAPTTAQAKKSIEIEDFTERTYGFEPVDLELIATSPLFTYDSGLTFEYPDAIRGIYVTGHSAGGAKFNKLVDLLDKTDLNAMVIDLKDDFGNITYVSEDSSPIKDLDIGKPYIKDPRTMLKTLEEKKIYPIGVLSFLKIVFLQR